MKKQNNYKVESDQKILNRESFDKLKEEIGLLNV